MGNIKKRKDLVILEIITGVTVIICVVGVFIYLNYFQITKPEDTIKKLETAMNDLDQTDILECFDDDVNKLYSGMLSFGEEYSGIDLSAWGDIAEGLGGIISSTDLVPQVDMIITDISYTDNEHCIVQVKVNTTYSGQTETDEIILPMKLEDRKWLITMEGYNAIR